MAWTGLLARAAWPVNSVYGIVKICGPPAIPPDVKGNFSGGKLTPWSTTVKDYIGVQCSQFPKVLLAVICWRYTVDIEAAAKGYDFTVGGWVMRIVFRDLLLMVVVAGGWDWLLYSSPLRQRMAGYKFERAYPELEQVWRDRKWTTCATLLASTQEVVLMRWWAGGHFKRPLFGLLEASEGSVPIGDANPFFGNDFTATYILWTLTMLYWRIAHFYFIHRAMHPWWDRDAGLASGDIGAVLYRYVHSHHHKSYNPTPWSGISMLPIESVSYISAALVPLVFRSGCHPWLHLYTKLDLIVGAQIGHDGFDAPGGGSYFHQLHHAHLECNYGDSNGIPFDWIFGTFESGSSYSGSQQKLAGGKMDTQDSTRDSTCHGFAPVTGVRQRKGGCENKQDSACSTATASQVSDRSFAIEDVAQHASRGDCWIVIQGFVIDVSPFLEEHPGGVQTLLNVGGKDASRAFMAVHRKHGGLALVERHLPGGIIGVVPDLRQAAEVVEKAGDVLTTSLFDELAAQSALNIAFAAVAFAIWRVIMGCA
eukprot:TRINITY_DN29455_c0_g1_i1.p1 TRINITY_DN29455_c0_g1~~TRINITY_DN29455_c0_g1_i1.p1  ORF type:complete len:536 (-),score=66.27 TRINITY_DN29455_c0_g1_i1:13-1620(-)